MSDAKIVKTSAFKLSLVKVRMLIKKLKVNPEAVSVETLHQGMLVELEHGLESAKTNVTDDDLIKTAKIALRHIMEFPDYYVRLEKMESKAQKFWSKRNKPNIFLE